MRDFYCYVYILYVVDELDYDDISEIDMDVVDDVYYCGIIIIVCDDVRSR